MRKFCLALRYFLVLSLTIASGWFMSDVWMKFQSKDTGIKQYSEIRTELPTTVICFDPNIKKSILSNQNITMYEFDNLDNLTKFPNPWLEFYQELHFRLGIDFYISLRNEPLLQLGANYIDSSLTLVVDELFTLWSGFCYKITPFGKPNLYTMIFELSFNETIFQSDIPNLQLVLTSEENAFGITGLTWIFGNELKIEVAEYETAYTIQASVGYEHCSLEILLGSLENLPARRALVLEMLEKNFARISLGSIGARKNLCSSSLGSIFLCSKCSNYARFET